MTKKFDYAASDMDNMENTIFLSEHDLENLADYDTYIVRFHDRIMAKKFYNDSVYTIGITIARQNETVIVDFTSDDLKALDWQFWGIYQITRGSVKI